MLLKAILKYLSNSKIKHSLVEDELTHKTIKIQKSEKSFKKLEGLHKLVRVSPFGKNNKTHTSLCFISLTSHIEKKETEIKDEELKYDFFKSTGPGGQHKNKTLSAVRLTHLPTNTVVVSGNERSQLDNKKIALEQLNIKLKNLNNQKIVDDSKRKRDDYIKNQFFTATYSLISNIVKCEENNKKSSNVKAFFNGELELIFDL